jgi:hypothetical protein
VPPKKTKESWCLWITYKWWAILLILLLLFLFLFYYFITIIVYVINTIVLHLGDIFRIEVSFPYRLVIPSVNSYTHENHWELFCSAVFMIRSPIRNHPRQMSD